MRDLESNSDLGSNEMQEAEQKTVQNQSEVSGGSSVLNEAGEIDESNRQTTSSGDTSSSDSVENNLDVSRIPMAQSSATSATALEPTKMAAHKPIQMKLTNPKTRKRKINSAASPLLADDDESAGEDDNANPQPGIKKASVDQPRESDQQSTTVEVQESTSKESRSPDASAETHEEPSETTHSDQGDSPSAQPHHHHHHATQRGASSDQPDGWRVKLYRLNMDGSWDDCGTGRIVCLYRSQTARTGESQENENHNPNEHPVQSPQPGPHQTTDQWLYQETGEATLCVQAEITKANRQPRVLLRTRILLREAYQRQGDNIITWCEPFYGQNRAGQEDNEMPASSSDNNNLLQQPGGGVDLALSFQDNAGCLDIWRQITQVQSRAAELLRSLPSDESHSVQRMAAAYAAQHAADIHNQDGGEGRDSQNNHPHNQGQPDVVVWGGNHMNEEGSPGQADYAMLDQPVHLPDPPSLGNLEQIADTIAAIHNVQQREAMAVTIAKDECAYLRALLALFPAAEERNDYGKLATLAACVKTILLLNEPSILELIVAVAEMFEQVCSCLEYDPDLREKANHRWFLRERAKFRTVVAMDNIELVSAIHRSFRVNYLKDTLLRPTMDESSLSTLSSLQTFSHADVVKGVTMSPNGEEVSLTESYLVRVIRMLGVELHAICVLEWNELDSPSDDSEKMRDNHDDLLYGTRDPSTVVGKNPLHGTTWRQYLAPQDSSLPSRRIRRRGCLSFLRELFNMVRLSLQQNDKDDFFSVICTLDVDLVDDVSDNISQTSQTAEVGSVASTVKSDQTGHYIDIPQPSSPIGLLSLLGNALADPNIDISEKGAVLEIVAGVAMHDPSFIRRHCIDHHTTQKELENESRRDVPQAIAGRPDPNEKQQVIDVAPQNDLLASLLYILDVTSDAGILLQATEIMRIILDTDIAGDNGSFSAGFKDEAEGVPLGHTNSPHHDQHTQPSQGGVTTNDQKQFFSIFYENYMEWLVAPFQFTILHPVRRVPENVLKNPSESASMQKMLASWSKGVRGDDKLLRTVPFDAIRSSFAVELLSFCVRAHLYWMKHFLLRSKVLKNVMGMLKPAGSRSRQLSGDRCLKLAALRFLRSILSVQDEFYHRHIIQNDLFGPVFAALRENPVGDNLVSSSIVEMCDYIHNENIKSLLEYLVTKHISAEDKESDKPRLEELSSPYVSTLTVLREAYEANRNATDQMDQRGFSAGQASPGGSSYYPPSGASPNHSAPLSGKALEDQRKFREADEEEAYFESSESEKEVEVPSPSPIVSPKGSVVPPPSTLSVPMAVDEVDTAAGPGATVDGSTELHRTPRMFSLAQTPLFNHLEASSENQPPSTEVRDQEMTDSGEQTESPPSIDTPSPPMSNA